MGNPSAATIVTGALGTALAQVQTDATKFIAQGLSIGLAIMGTIPTTTVGVKASRRFVK